MEVLAYHLEDLGVKLVVRVPQFGNPCSKFNTVYIISLNIRNVPLFVCLHGCAVACTSYETKSRFSQCGIFL